MFDHFPILETERLSLIEIVQEHKGDIFELFSDDKVTEFYNVTTLTSEDQAQQFIDWFRSRFYNNAGIRWGIAIKGSANIIGTVGFNNFTKEHRANIVTIYNHNIGIKVIPLRR
ncbi:MAG: GCN5-related N-acetyltransferase [Segetibacter sp.]|nr:GCN5-related N-acetyltransferase [Segetibacter sp.]